MKYVWVLIFLAGCIDIDRMNQQIDESTQAIMSNTEAVEANCKLCKEVQFPST